MPVNTKVNKPELNVEALWSIFKCMFGLLIFTNLLWASFTIYYVHKSITDVSPSIEMTQDGQDNNQSLTNG